MVFAYSVAYQKKRIHFKREMHQKFHLNNFVVSVYITISMNVVRSSQNIPVFSDFRNKIFIMVMN